MQTTSDLRAAIKSLSTRMIDIANGNESAVAKKAALMPMAEKLKAAQSELADLEHVASQVAILNGSGVSNVSGVNQPGLSFAGKSAAPAVLPDRDQLHAMHEAIVSRKSYRVEVKATTDVSGMLPAERVPGIVAARHEPRRVLDFLPSSPVGSPTWEYFRHASTTGTMTTVAPGGLKPELSLNVDTVTGTVRKIAAHVAVEDETLADFEGFLGYVQTELERIYIDTENAQLLLGDGTGTNILGLLNGSGLLTRSYTTDHTADATVTGLDTLESAITDLRVGAAYAFADLIVLHPTTWSKLRRTKDSYGNYILGAPTTTDPTQLWGVPVLTTSSIPVGTAMVSQLAAAGEARIRQGVTIESTPYNADDWTHNLTRFRVEARIGLGVVRPAAISKVTGL